MKTFTPIQLTPEERESFARAMKKTAEDRAIEEEFAIRKKQFRFVILQCTCGGDFVFVRKQVATIPTWHMPMGPSSLNYYQAEDTCSCKRCGITRDPEAELIQEALNEYLARIHREVEEAIRNTKQTE